MKKSQIASSLVLSLIAVAPANMYAEDCCLPEYRPGEPLCDDTACAIYTRYAGVEIDCGCNVFAWGEFLYWRPVQETVWTAIRADNAAFGQPALGSTQIELSPTLAYRPAFSVGIGMHLPCFDDWILGADYLWFHHDFHKSYNATPPAFLATTTVLGTPLTVPFYSSIRNKFEICYDIVSAQIQRPNYLVRNVIISPFFAFRWLRRSQSWTLDAVNSLTTLTDGAKATSSWNAVGIAGGFNGSYLMCWNFRLIGKADVALMYPYHRKFSETDTFTPPGSPITLIATLKQSDKHLDILARGGMGVGWGSYFCCNRYHVDFAATFDFMADVPKISFTTGMFSGSSMLFIGLTIRGVFDF